MKRKAVFPLLFVAATAAMFFASTSLRAAEDVSPMTDNGPDQNGVVGSSLDPLHKDQDRDAEW